MDKPNRFDIIEELVKRYDRKREIQKDRLRYLSDKELENLLNTKE